MLSITILAIHFDVAALREHIEYLGFFPNKPLLFFQHLFCSYEQTLCPIYHHN